MNKRVISLLMAVAVISSTAAFAGEEIPMLQTIKNESVILKSEQPAASADFGYFEGTITKINRVEQGLSLSIKSKESEATFIVNKGTYIHNKKDYKVGQSVKGYYANNVPMIMIYPPQYTIEALVFVDDFKNSVEVSKFDETLVNTINTLKINVSKNLKVVNEEGNPYVGSIENKNLLVEYDRTTRSIPAQTTPIKVVVLKTLMQEYNESIEYSKMDLVIGDKVVGAGKAINIEGVAMIELKCVTDALGLKTSYDKKLRTVYVGKSQLKLGVNSYSFAKMAPMKLEAAPAVVKGRTYVPLSFFRKVLQLNNAYVFENQIVINNYERME